MTEAHHYTRHRPQDRRAIHKETNQPIIILDYAGNGEYLGKYVPFVRVWMEPCKTAYIPFMLLMTPQPGVIFPDISATLENWEKNYPNYGQQ